MISEERQGELMADLEYSVNKYLNNQGILDIAIGDGCNTGEEEEFLRSCFSYFSVMLPEVKDELS